MKHALFALALALIPAFAHAEVPEWAQPETTTRFPESQLKPIGDADTAARVKMRPLVPQSVPELIRNGMVNPQTHNPGFGVCMNCHTPGGFGMPQSAPLAGLPAGYFLRQLQDMVSGERKPYRPQMAEFARLLTPEDMKQLAEFYASQRFIPWIDVRETDSAPKTVVGPRDIIAAAPEGGETPLGSRIVELSNGAEQPYVPNGPAYTAYVPIGSLRRGESLVNRGGDGRTIQCTSCHGGNLLGNSVVPPIAGRSPVYTARQLYQFKDGNRGGSSAAAMKRVVMNLSDDDIIGISAYLASRPPA
jgi:cytochrome c553